MVKKQEKVAEVRPEAQTEAKKIDTKQLKRYWTDVAEGKIKAPETQKRKLNEGRKKLSHKITSPVDKQ